MAVRIRTNRTEGSLRVALFLILLVFGLIFKPWDFASHNVYIRPTRQALKLVFCQRFNCFFHEFRNGYVPGTKILCPGIVATCQVLTHGAWYCIKEPDGLVMIFVTIIIHEVSHDIADWNVAFRA